MPSLGRCSECVMVPWLVIMARGARRPRGSFSEAQTPSCPRTSRVFGGCYIVGSGHFAANMTGDGKLFLYNPRASPGDPRSWHLRAIGAIFATDDKISDEGRRSAQDAEVVPTCHTVSD